MSLLSLINTEIELRIHWMITAVIDFSTNEPLITVSAFVILKSCINLHEYVFPRNSLLPQEHNELVDVPCLIRYMLSNDGSIEVNKDLSLGAHHPFTLC
jgi:hypothetical protein